jgi:hypothetical protein
MTKAVLEARHAVNFVLARSAHALHDPILDRALQVSEYVCIQIAASGFGQVRFVMPRVWASQTQS